jgi:hypothetical protein
MNLEEAKALHLAIDVDETIERYADAENVAKYRKAALAIEDLVYREIEKVEARG